jgi:hypothetical protein
MSKEELNIYMHYVYLQAKLKNTPNVIDLLREKGEKGRQTPDKIVGQVGFTWYWKDVQIKSIDELKAEDGMYNWKWYSDLYKSYTTRCHYNEYWDKQQRIQREWFIKLKKENEQKKEFFKRYPPRLVFFDDNTYKLIGFGISY